MKILRLYWRAYWEALGHICTAFGLPMFLMVAAAYLAVVLMGATRLTYGFELLILKVFGIVPPYLLEAVFVVIVFAPITVPILWEVRSRVDELNNRGEE